MVSNEDYLDELLKSMSEEKTEESAFARFGIQPEPKATESVLDGGMGMMDQAMIDALLAGASGNMDIQEPVVEETKIMDISEEEPIIGETLFFDSPEDFEKALMAELEAENQQNSENIEGIGDISDFGNIEELGDISDIGNIEGIGDIVDFGNIEGIGDIADFGNIEEFGDISDLGNIEGIGNIDNTNDIESSADMGEASRLAQLMAEMREESQDSDVQSFDDDFMTEESIEALLSAAKNTKDDIYEEQPISFDMSDDSSMAEIEALLGMAETDEILEENSSLLRMLEEASGDSVASMDAGESFDIDEAELDAILSMGNPEEVSDAALEDLLGGSEKKKKKEKVKKEKSNKESNGEKEKKSWNFKELFGKIFSVLLEEIPDEDSEKEDSINISKENQMILDELDQEGNKKIKVSAKKEKKEKEKKEKPPKNKKPKKEKFLRLNH